MTIYRVHFSWKEKEYILKATLLDLTHPYFVSIKDLILPKESSVLINPADDEIRKNFGKVRHLMLPFQSVSLIEEFSEDPDKEDHETLNQTKSIIKNTRGEVVESRHLFTKSSNFSNDLEGNEDEPQ